MDKVTNINDMGKAFQEILLAYDKEVTEATKKAVTEVADGVMRATKSHITWNDKEYSKAFELKTIYDNDRGKYVIWHVGKVGTKEHWRLTHLLELGHITRDGTTWTRKFPHVQYGAEFVTRNLANEIKEEIEKCNN